MITWIGPLGTETGYAEEGRAFVAALRLLTSAVHIVDIPVPERADQISDLPQPAVATRASRDLHIYHRYWPAPPVQGNAINVWRTMFETTQAPIEFVRAAEAYDYIWVPSRFNYETFRYSGIPEQKLRIVNSPNPTWANLLTQQAHSESGREDTSSEVLESSFKFASVFRWQRRKGWDVLLDAFTTVARDLDVPLSLSIQASLFDARDRGQIIRDLHGVDQWKVGESTISVRTDRIPKAQLLDLYARSDAFIMASRGEGWGRPYVEATLAGLPIIAPRWSGCAEFMTEINSFSFGGTIAPVGLEAENEWAFFQGQSWFEPDLSSVCDAIRAAVERGRPSSALRRKISSDMAERFSIEAIACQMSRVLGQDGIDASLRTVL